MSTVIDKLLKQYTQENAETQLMEVDDGNDVDPAVLTADKALDEQSRAIDEVVSLESSLSSLIDHTFNTYGTSGMSKVESQLYHLSVESVLRTSKVNCFTDLELFSAEAAEAIEEPTTKEEKVQSAAKKADGMLKRLLTWIADAWNTFANMLSDFMSKLITSANGLEEKAKKLLEKAKGVTGTKEGTIKVGAAGRYLMDKAGAESVGVSHVNNTVTEFNKFAVIWGEGWNALNDFNIGGKDASEQLDSAAHAMLVANHALGKMIKDGDFQIIPLPNHLLKVEVVAEHTYLKSQRCEFEMIHPKGLEDVRTLKADELSATLERVISAIGVYRKADTAVAKLIKAVRTFSSNAKKVAVVTNTLAASSNRKNDENTTERMLGYRDAARSMVLASKISMFGWQKTMPMYLQYMNANLKHVIKSIAFQSKAE